MSTEQGTRTAEPEASNTTSHGTSTALNVVLFLVLFGLFLAGVYVMSLFTPWTFIAGLAMCMLALFLTFDTVPRFLT